MKQSHAAGAYKIFMNLSDAVGNTYENFLADPELQLRLEADNENANSDTQTGNSSGNDKNNADDKNTVVDEISDTAVGPTDNKECDNTPEGPNAMKNRFVIFLTRNRIWGLCQTAFCDRR